MNLIEQLGGYENSRGLLNLYEYSISFKYYKEFGGDFESAGHVDVFIPDLKDALLKYRRQHNIYENGDWVFPVVRIIDEIEGVGRYICAEKGELVVAREVKNKGAYCSHEHRLDNSFYMKFSEFRHATDAEIAAGKRLEVKSEN